MIWHHAHNLLLLLLCTFRENLCSKYPQRNLQTYMKYLRLVYFLMQLKILVMQLFAVYSNKQQNTKIKRTAYVTNKKNHLLYSFFISKLKNKFSKCKIVKIRKNKFASLSASKINQTFTRIMNIHIYIYFLFWALFNLFYEQ